MVRFLAIAAIFGVQALVAPPVLACEMHVRTSQPVAAAADEAAFLKENEAAMTKMMNGMAARPAGDIDKDFVAMMAPHHQGAIDMAVLELRYGTNEHLRRIAQEIIVGQMQEIAAMRLALGQPVPSSAPAPTQPAPQAGEPDGMPMQMNMSNSESK
jgi:uncharacterized protein (DUF305 family)